MDTQNSSQKSYGQILKSSALIGGFSVINIALGIVRAKAMALILGPAGVGLLGLYSSVADLARSVGGMGLSTSGVRQIAEAAGSGQEERLARTVVTLRRVVLLLGLAGGLAMVLLAGPISWLAFGDFTHAGAVALLAVAVLFGTITVGQTALIQGMRNIRDLALAGVLGSFLGTAVSIPVVFLLGEQGIVWSLIGVSVAGVATSWYYSRKVKVRLVDLSLRDLSAELSTLLNLGLVFMLTGLLGLGVPCLVRIMVVRQMGLDEAGAYQAAWALGGMYVGIILQAMGADFFPRLTAAAEDNSQCNRLVNEQTEVSLLLAGPGVLATLAIPHLVIQVFYSGKFGAAVEILRWIALGMLARIVVWPMCYILMAKGAKSWYLATEVVGALLQLLLVWIGIQFFGLNGTGMAFFGSYLLWGVLVYFVVHSVSGFRWSGENLRLGILYLTLVIGLFVSWYVLPRAGVVVIGAAVTSLSAWYSLKRLSGLVPFEKFPRLVQKGLRLLRFGPPAAVVKGPA